MKRASANTQLCKADQLHLIWDLRVVAAGCLREEEDGEVSRADNIISINRTNLANLWKSYIVTPFSKNKQTLEFMAQTGQPLG